MIIRNFEGGNPKSISSNGEDLSPPNTPKTPETTPSKAPLSQVDPVHHTFPSAKFDELRNVGKAIEAERDSLNIVRSQLDLLPVQTSNALQDLEQRRVSLSSEIATRVKIHPSIREYLQNVLTLPVAADRLQWLRLNGSASTIDKLRHAITALDT